MVGRASTRQWASRSRRAGVRIERLEAVVDLLRQSAADGEVKLDQGGVFAQGFEAVPKPFQPGGPPIMIGGGSPRVLRLAGAKADIVSLNFDNSSGRIGADGVGSSTADQTAAKLQWVREGAGERFEQLELEIGAYFVAVTDDPDAALRRLSAAFDLPAGRAGDAPARARRLGRCDLRRVGAPPG